MQGDATITFTQPGVQPPVYVVTSLSTPPWAPLELKPSEEKTPSGDMVFEHRFGNVAEGSYQYKIRIGEGHWVLDESKETAADELGNRNNVVHVSPAESNAAIDRTANTKDTLDRKDSTLDTSDMNPGPIPFVVVEKATDRNQPEYGDVHPRSFVVDESKRAADPDPDFEETKTDSPLDTESLKSPEVPLVMVEKVDDKPVNGDDFGQNATNGRKLAHELGSADASPDRLIISPDESNELESEDEQAPLFRHESFQDSKASLPEPAMDAIEEESVQSSTDHTSSGDAMDTPSAESQDESQDNNELGHGPLLPHETDFRDNAGELKSMSLLSHETEDETKEDDEFTEGPLLSHETGFTLPARDDDSDYEEDEHDVAPLLPHETGSLSYKVSEAAIRSSRLTRDKYEDEPYHYTQHGDDSDDGENHGELDLAPTFSHERDLLAEDHGAPLLPHERGSAAESVSGSERSSSMSPTTYESAYPALGQEMDSAGEIFGGSMRSSFFRTRTSSSTLPNKLPRSDAEDLNLHDLGLEAFPVGRDQIYERVATIGRKLPEDETHDMPTSPQSSVFSQACSSVDLVPVKSYLSLASVREDSEEEDEGQDADVESLPSPVFMSQQSARFARDTDPLATPHPDDSKQLGFVPDEKPETETTHAAESSEADSVSKTDGAKDSSKGMTSLSDIVASRATVMNTLTPPLTPRALQAISDKETPMTAPESELRQRREPVKDNTESSLPIPRPDNKDQGLCSTDPLVVTSGAEEPKPRKSSLQDWKRASIGVPAVVAAVAACYYLAVVR
ncbi:uncharacterized protein EKO05_0011402 [Ascochyta rabiei]|uniref:uncharacterized protein n=1 Tax=Didymella rabiei TaxID=5454 RepID=UPI0022026C94|nr:uncharacterized protein EKO05_0011402 [Ascochyta rabiei]UPX21208.1 hypothetical protein EKO05_0011402 [Ascochyta rabiei]